MIPGIGTSEVCRRRLPGDFCAPVIRYGYAGQSRYWRCGAKTGQYIAEYRNLLISCRPCTHTKIPRKAVLARNIIADSVGGKERTAVDIVDRAAGAAAFGRGIDRSCCFTVAQIDHKTHIECVYTPRVFHRSGEAVSYLNSFGMFGRGRPVVCDTACTEAKLIFLLTQRLKFRNIVGGSSGIRPIGERVALGVFRQYMAVQYRQSLCLSRCNIRLVGFVIQHRKLIVIFTVKHGINRLTGDHQCDGVFLAEVKIALLRVIKRVIIGRRRHAVQHHGIVAAGVEGGAVFL